MDVGNVHAQCLPSQLHGRLYWLKDRRLVPQGRVQRCLLPELKRVAKRSVAAFGPIDAAGNCVPRRRDC